jgi:hypothetical protein
MIFIPGLTGPDFLEKVGIQGIPQVSSTLIDIPDVIHGKVGKDTGLNVTVTIDVKITRICSPARQTSIYIRAIIPEISGKQGVLVAHFFNPVMESHPLLRGQHETRFRSKTYGYILEKPTK